MLATVDVTFVVFAFIVVSASVATVDVTFVVFAFIVVSASVATVDVTFVVFAFIVVSASVATVVTVLGGTYSLPAKESHFLVFLNNLKGHSQLMQMRIRYHILADLHVTRRAQSLNHCRRFTVEKA